MIDWNQVDELCEAVGASEFMELVDVFLEEVEGVLYQLDDNSDASTLESQLHFLKGSALNLGFQDFSTLCQAGESEAKMGSTVGVDLGALKGSYDATKEEFLAKIKTRFAA